MTPINKFHDLNYWFEEIIHCFAIVMITNYIHMLGSSYIRYFLKNTLTYIGIINKSRKD